MKKNKTNRFFCALMLSINIIPASYVHAQSWQPLGTPGFSPSGSGVCNWQDIQVDNNNHVYVSFNDEGQGMNSGQGTVMKYDGTNWVSVGTPGFTPGFSHHSSFALGLGDTVYYAFSDGTASGFSRASVMRFDGLAWTNIGSNLTTGACQYSDIVVKNDGSVYFACIDNGMPNGAVVVKKYTGGTTWENVGSISPISTDGASYTSMSLDNSNVLHIAYQDKAEAPGKVRVKKYNGTVWENVGLPILSVTGIGASAAMDISLIFDMQNTPFVAYSHGFQGPPRTSVHSFDGTAWNLVGPAQFASGQFEVSLFNKLAIDKSGEIHLVYQHGGLGNKASVMKYNGTNWVNVGLPGFSAATTAHNGIAFDNNSNPYVVYYDDANGGKTTVMKYTICEAATVQTVAASQMAVCAEDSVLLSVTGALNDAANWEWTAGSCGGAPIGSGTSIYVTPEDTTTYFVRGLGNCVASGGCSSVTINVIAPKPLITIASNILTSSAAMGNQWYYNGSAIAGSTAQQHTATQNGWYHVGLTVGACTSFSDSVLVNTLSLSSEFLLKNLAIYPVPFYNELNVNFEQGIEESDISGITISDNLGRVVFTSTAIKSKNKIDLNSLHQGIYFLTVRLNNGSSQSFKVVKQK